MFSQRSHHRVRKFQTKPQIRLGLLSMTAAGVGLTLTAATTVIFAELHWTPGVLAQAEDRTHRIGQVNSVNVIYCVCKERDLSVDLSLWAMIGRKVNNLGRMIDGEKNASMNANHVENSTTELASFFAENSPNQKLANDMSSTPVKGTIQSFFVPKVKQATEKMKESCMKERSLQKFKPAPNPSPLVRKTGRDDSYQIVKTSSSANSLASNRNNKKKESWTCDRCTFINEDAKLFSCEMCGNPMQAQVTPCSEKSCSLSSVANSPDRKYYSPMGVIDLSHTSNDDVKLQSLVGAVDHIRSEDFQHINIDQDISSCSHIEINNDTSLTSQSGSLVQFKVSQNSGRIAIFGIDGASLNFNFDIDDVISEATGEILERYVKRTISQQRECISSEDVKFDEGGVNEGK